MSSKLLCAVLGGVAVVLLFAGPPTAQACHFRVRHAGNGGAYVYYGSNAPVRYWSYYVPVAVDTQSNIAEIEESEPGVVRASFSTTQPRIPAAAVPIRLAEPRVLPLSEMGNNNFPDD
jgi:hypothetical protein